MLWIFLDYCYQSASPVTSFLPYYIVYKTPWCLYFTDGQLFNCRDNHNYVIGNYLINIMYFSLTNDTLCVIYNGLLINRNIHTARTSFIENVLRKVCVTYLCTYVCLPCG